MLGLTALHFQFAPWVAFHRESFAHIEACQAELPGCRLAIEFRNRTWFEGKHAETTLRFQRERIFRRLGPGQQYADLRCAIGERGDPQFQPGGRDVMHLQRQYTRRQPGARATPRGGRTTGLTHKLRAGAIIRF